MSIRGATVTFGGGGGETLTINADGSYLDDYGEAQPATGSSDGHTYEIAGTGSGTGHIITSAPKVMMTPADAGAITHTVNRDGDRIIISRPLSSVFLYACTPHRSLALTDSQGLTTKYVTQ